MPSPLVERMYPRDIAMEETLNEVELDLGLSQDSEGALLCEYDTFRKVYEFQRRGLSRYRQSFYVAVIKLRLEDEARDESWAVAEGMQWMGTVLKKMLGQSDTAARYSATQYVTLIQEQDGEQVQRKLQGIGRLFSQGETVNGLLVSWEYRPQGDYLQEALRG